MKIYVGGFTSCTVHNEKYMLENVIKKTKNEFADSITDADLIIYLDSCIGTYDSFLFNFKKLSEIFSNKKESAKVVISGCLSKGVKFELNDIQKLILSKCSIVLPENIVSWVENYLTNNKVINSEAFIPYTLDNGRLSVSLVNGCLNHCSFCKVAYANFDLKSYPLESVKSLVKHLNDEEQIKFLSMFSSNLSLYGIDLYKEPRAHEVIRLLTSIPSLQYAYCGALINYYPELIKEIIENPKIKGIFTSLESGSLKLYNTMNRPISLEKTIDVIKTIKSNRPDILIKTELIAGYPGETLDDIKKTIDLVKELNLYVDHVWPYVDSPQIKSSLLRQHSERYKNKSAKYYLEHLKEHIKSLDKKIIESEAFIIDRIEELELYEVLLQDGTLIYIEFKDLDRKYNKGDLIPQKSLKYKK